MPVIWFVQTPMWDDAASDRSRANNIPVGKQLKN